MRVSRTAVDITTEFVTVCVVVCIFGTNVRSSAYTVAIDIVFHVIWARVISEADVVRIGIVLGIFGA
jgi:hypothetical protein